MASEGKLPAWASMVAFEASEVVLAATATIIASDHQFISTSQPLFIALGPKDSMAAV